MSKRLKSITELEYSRGPWITKDPFGEWEWFHFYPPFLSIDVHNGKWSLNHAYSEYDPLPEFDSREGAIRGTAKLLGRDIPEEQSLKPKYPIRYYDLGRKEWIDV